MNEWIYCEFIKKGGKSLTPLSNTFRGLCCYIQTEGLFYVIRQYHSIVFKISNKRVSFYWFSFGFAELVEPVHQRPNAAVTCCHLVNGFVNVLLGVAVIVTTN